MYMYMEVMTRIEEKRSSVGSRRRKDRRGQGGGRTGEDEERDKKKGRTGVLRIARIRLLYNVVKKIGEHIF